MSDSRPPANPFAEDAPERVPPPSSLIIFGATGDLAARKLLPAVYNLAAVGKLPQTFRLVGVSSNSDELDFRKSAHKAMEEFSRTGVDDAVWKRLEDRIDFVAGDFNSPELYADLAKQLTAYDEADGMPTRKMFYLATAPRFFGPIATRLAEAGLGKGADPATVLLVEKPFGHDLESAVELNKTLQDAFDELDIFRIDHYLGKETVQNLLVLRFANGIFEPIWNRRYVDHVQVTMAEDLGIGERAGYYDSSGALRDVLENHLMQLVALVAMEPPVSFEANLIRNEKVKLFEAVKPLDPAAGDLVRGQYEKGWIGGEEVVGYLDEDGIPKDSRTDTYAAARLEIDNWRWAGTPFYLRTGKRLRTRNTEIAIRFKSVPHLPFSGTGAAGVVPNELIISVQPREGASLRMVAKVPGSEMEVRPVQMDFQYGEAFLRESPEAYERLLHDALIGDATLFTRADEVEAQWKIAEPVVEAWDNSTKKPESYESGGQGPKASDDLLARDGREWRKL